MEEITQKVKAEQIFRPCIYILDRSGQIQEYLLDRTLKIGRTVGQAEIVIPSKIVSRVHGEFTYTGHGVSYRDLNSSNGTYINDRLYGVGSDLQEKVLEDGDVLKIDGDMKDKCHPEAVLILYRTTMATSPRWEQIDLSDDQLQIDIGRSSVAAPTAFADSRISRHHATFFCAEDGWAIVDHNSTNGVFLNNVKIDEAVYLKELDSVRIVDNMFIYMDHCLIYSINESEPVLQNNHYEPQIAAQTPNEPVSQIIKSTAAPEGEKQIGNSLSINIVKRTVRHGFKKLTLLKDIQLTINPGEMVLILGGSGAGKTTFMNAVMGYEKATGYIKHGDVDIYSQYNKMKYNIGFVPQDVLLRENDTVYETLYNAAEMKMPRKTTVAERKKRVEEVLDMVNLTHVSSSLVRSVSGGEKKRVSAGVELVADPGLFFLDEPDSGLDAQSAMELMDNLRQIANAGKIVMIISHSPDRAAKLFDKVIVLAKSKKDNSGHLAFFGSVPEARSFFETDSLEGVVSKINGKNGQGEFFIEKWENQKK